MPQIKKLKLFEVSNVTEGSNGRPFIMLRGKKLADKPFDKNSETATVKATEPNQLTRGNAMTTEPTPTAPAAGAAPAAAAPAPAAAPAATETVTVERAMLDKQASELVELRRALDEQKTSREMEVEINRAKTDLPLVGDAVKLGTAVFEINRAVAAKALSKESADTILEALKRAQAVAKQGAVFAETGHAGAAPGGATEQLQALARAKAQADGIPYAKALVAVTRANPQLYAQAQKEG